MTAISELTESLLESVISDPTDVYVGLDDLQVTSASKKMTLDQ
jgi:hypothetical protein